MPRFGLMKICGTAMLIAATALVGCGGSSGSPGSGSCSSNSGAGSVSAGGYYTGTLSIGGTDYSLVGLIDENGNARISEWGTQGPFGVITPSAPIKVSNGSFSVTGNIYAISGFALDNGSNVETVTVSGNVIAGTSICGTSTDGAGKTGSFSIKNDAAIYNLPASLSTVAGTYISNFSGGGVEDKTVSINSAGQITGSGPSGCNITGFITVPDPSHNAYALTLNDSCLPGPLTALAFYSGGAPGTGTFEVFGSDGSNGFFFYLNPRTS